MLGMRHSSRVEVSSLQYRDKSKPNFTIGLCLKFSFPAGGSSSRLGDATQEKYSGSRYLKATGPVTMVALGYGVDMPHNTIACTPSPGRAFIGALSGTDISGDLFAVNQTEFAIRDLTIGSGELPPR